MKIGDQLVVKTKYCGLLKGVDYYFLCSNSESKKVRLVIFQAFKSGYTVQLISIPRDDFEEGLVEGKIIHAKVQRKFPIWLSGLEGVDLTFVEQLRRSASKSYFEYVQERYSIIYEAIRKREEILRSDDLVRVLNKLASQPGRRQNPGRFKLWFFVYTLFGDNIWSLLPPFHNIGKWDREALGQTSRFGRRDLEGDPAQFNVDSEMKNKIRSGFSKYADPHETRMETYRAVIVNEFGCKSIFDQNGNIRFIHPSSKPFPSLDQFNYWVGKIFHAKDVREVIKGKYSARSQSGHIGRFTEGLSSVYEKVEFDGYYFNDKATALDGVTPISGYCVVRGVCGLSGAVLGVGFARGAENLEAYKMALFSMAINKAKFLSLFGYKTRLAWPCEGLGPDVITDRGPGATLDVESEINWLSSFELTPSASGQSKATVEASHDRKKKVPDDKGHFHSKLDYLKLAKREIAKAIDHNHISDASGRMTPEMWKEGFFPTPHNIWSYLSQRGRSSARTMVFEDAVRKFLTSRPVTIKRDGIYLEGFNYFSSELESIGLFDFVARNGSISTSAFVMNMCVRNIWLDYEGRIYELSARYPMRVAEEEKYITIYELEEIAHLRAKTKAKQRHAASAVRDITNQDFHDSTGMEMNSGERKTGRHKRSLDVRRAEASQKKLLGK